MNITPLALRAQATTALQVWPFIPLLEKQYELPPFALVAIASRETNCVNEPGDPTPRRDDPPDWVGKPYHAWSPWQIDRNSGGSPVLLSNIPLAAAIAADMLRRHFAKFHSWKAAFSAYNAGEGGAQAGLQDHGDSDFYTTGKDYGADVGARVIWLQSNMHYPIPPTQRKRVDTSLVVSPDGSRHITGIDPNGHLLYFFTVPGTDPNNPKSWHVMDVTDAVSTKNPPEYILAH